MYKLLLLIILCLTVTSTPCFSQNNFNDPKVQREIKALENEPNIQEVHKAALKFYHAEPDTISSMRTRAQLKSLLPDVHVRYRMSNNGVGIEY